MLYTTSQRYQWSTSAWELGLDNIVEFMTKKIKHDSEKSYCRKDLGRSSKCTAQNKTCDPETEHTASHTKGQRNHKFWENMHRY